MERHVGASIFLNWTKTRKDMGSRRPPTERWTIRDAEELYSVRDWGAPHFGISRDGEMTVSLGVDGRCCTVSLAALVRELGERGVQMPVLLRFADLLDARLRMLNEHFRAAIAEAGYKGDYLGVYPIKVNQQQQVIEEIAGFGRKYHHGLEAGSKAELIAALTYIDDPEALVICNGYKDAEFVDLALLGTKLGTRTVLVVEMPGEAQLILERAEALAVEPVIGVRMRPATRGTGHWNESGGDRSVFGLNPSQMVDLVDFLRERGKLDCLRMLHYHLGSQLPNVRDIRTGIAEAARNYVELVREGAPMGLLDVGGGLAVDYDGSQTNFESSCNYCLKEYCDDIVEAVLTVCEEYGVPHPTLVSESGRAVVAYYSILIFNILGVNRSCSHQLPEVDTEEVHDHLVNLLEVGRMLNVKNVLECFHDLLYYRDEVRSVFQHGGISLRERAQADAIFWNVLTKIADLTKECKFVPEELQTLDVALSDIYYGNFSVFQSLPDAWAIDQLFPIVPIQRLNEKPDRSAIIADITCDCDGKIDRFIDLHDVRRSLPVHSISPGEDYMMGVFLVGAYQETLGDLHNLLGDTNVVSVQCRKPGEVEFVREIAGDTISDVLSYVEYDPREMIERMRGRAEKAVRDGRIQAGERRAILRAFKDGLDGYTYYEI